MNLAVLDGYALNPGDLDWGAFRRLCDCQIFDRTSEEDVVARARDAEILLTNKCPVRRAHMEQLPQLKYIGVLATGFNIVDVEAAKERGIPVTNVPAYGTASVAQMTFALILELCQRAGAHSEAVRSGEWARCPDFCFWKHNLIELQGLNLGIVGFGRIGRAVAAIGQAFGMTVIYHTPRPPVEGLDGARPVSMDALFSDSDVLSFHCPLTDSTRHLANESRLRTMRSGAFLINTSRGLLVDEEALHEALKEKWIAGAALDVMGSEPPAADHPLYALENCLITPHIAWATFAARKRLMRTVEENVRSFLSGKPLNVVNL